MKLPAVLPEGFLQAFPPEERQKLGCAGMTAEQAQAKYIASEEKRLQQDIATWLDHEQIYFETDRMDRKTSGKKGRADFRICVDGRWLSIEAKTQSGNLTGEQLTEATRLQKSWGKFAVCRSLKEAIDVVRSIRPEQL